MGLGDILSKSISYPFSDLQKFLIVGILAVLSEFDDVINAAFGTSMTTTLIGSIIALIFAIVLIGYSLEVIKKGIDYSVEVPSVEFTKNFVDGIKVLVIGFVYFLIPIIITLVLLFLFGAIGSGLNHAAASLGIWVVVALIIFIIFAIFEIIAEARFAVSGSIGDALNLSAVLADVKRIGILKIILFLIASAIVFTIAVLICKLLAIIPIIGIIIGSFALYGFYTLFYNYGIGLLYAE